MLIFCSNDEGEGDNLRGYCGEDNARLIAAAPMLLEALQSIVTLWDHHASAHGDGIIYPRHEAARAAISRATGKD
jgi:hypothetical protein